MTDDGRGTMEEKKLRSVEAEKVRRKKEKGSDLWN